MEENINKEEIIEEIKETVPEYQPVKKNRKGLIKNIVIASLSVLLAASVACNIAQAVRRGGMHQAMREQRIEQCQPGGNMQQGQMPNGNMQQGQMPDRNTQQGQMPNGQAPNGQAPNGQAPDSNTQDNNKQNPGDKSSENKSDDNSKADEDDEKSDL